MKIHVLANDGSQLGCTLSTLMGNDPKQLGVGGAECALLTMCELWHNRGDEVILYNNPRLKDGSPFEQRKIVDFEPDEDRDVLIVFRSTNIKAINAKGLRVWFSCDQFATGNFAQFRQFVHKVVLISPTHDDYFKRVYGINDGIVIDLPVRVWEYEGKNIEKVKNRFIFTSVPARGLDTMLEIWPRIRQEIPDASLVITSDYRLWGCGRGNELFLGKALGLDGVQYLGAVTRPRLVEEQLKAEIHMYPCNYEELFCIAVAESQVAGAYPITSDMGALPTTNMGLLISGDLEQHKNDFVDWSIDVSKNRDFYAMQTKALQKRAIERFHPDRIMSEWDSKVFQ